MTVDYEWFRAELEPYLNRDRWLVAYSGGLDSSVLLRLLVEIRNSGDSAPSLEAVHVNHGLSAEAHQWQQHCIDTCAQYQVPLTVIGVDVVDDGLGLEAAARQARYQQFEQILSVRALLLMAHHLDDQVETFFLRLLRGSGVDGLVAMPSHRDLGQGQIFRPLLAVARSELEHMAKAFGLSWVEDDSNTDMGFDRNFLRSQILPLVEQRWPGYRKTVTRAVDHMIGSRQIVSKVTAAELEVCSEGANGQKLMLGPLLSHEEVLSASILRAWLGRQQLPVPRSEQLKEFLQQIRSKASDTSPILHGRGYEIRSFQHELYLLAPEVEFDSAQSVEVKSGQEIVIDGVGTVKIEVGSEWSAEFISKLSIRFRQGGERCRPCGREHTQSLKKLMQEYQIEPWWRARVPLIYLADRLLAVGDYWLCAGTEPEYQLPPLKVSWIRQALNNHN